jgi:hypothetical protein
MFRIFLLMLSFILVLSLNERSKRSRILLMDSGVNPVGIEKYLCEDGQKSFLEGKHKDPFVDSTGHGTMMAHAMAETLEPAKHCIVIYKTYPGHSGVDAAEAYAHALIRATDEDFIAVAIAIEDTGHYFAEAGWYRALKKNS